MEATTVQHDAAKLRRALIIMLAAVALMRVALTFVYEANWDEYLNLSMVYDHQRGELREILQTGFVHLFGWVALISENEANQIIAARVAYLAVGVVTSLAIWSVTRALTSTNAALFAVLSYWAFGFTLIHGVAFRTDPLAASAMMCALWHVVCKSPTMRVALAAGALAGLAGVFTIKAVFYLPALVLIALIRSETVVRGLGLIVVASVAAGVSFLGLTALHAMTFPDFASPLAFLDRTTGSTMSTQDFGILKRFLWPAFAKSFVFFAVLGFGLVGLFKRLSDPARRTNGFIALAMLTPLLSVLVYRDVYPYFYPFILAPVVVLAGFAWEELSRRFNTRTMLLIAGVLCANAAIATAEKLQRPINAQRAALEVIHRLFPEDVPYIDARSMVSSKRKRGLFMSAWGMTDYRQVGKPVMEDVIRTEQPQFVLANGWQLRLDQLSPEQSEAEQFGLLAADLQVLKDNYLRIWGPLYVPGKIVQPEDTALRVLLPGTYQVVADASLTLGDQTISPNDTVDLEARDYAVSTESTAIFVRDIEVPQEAPPSSGLFGDF